MLISTEHRISTAHENQNVNSNVKVFLFRNYPSGISSGIFPVNLGSHLDIESRSDIESRWDIVSRRDIESQRDTKSQLG